MEILGNLNREQQQRFLEWARSQPIAEVTSSSYVNGRLEKWYHLGSNLQSIRLGRAKVTLEESLPGWLVTIGNKALPGWNSALLCGGPTTINWHRDHGHFLGPAAMINMGNALYVEASRNADTSKPNSIIGVTHDLKDGNVVLIDTKCPHRAEQKSTERFNLTFRTIKPEFFKPDYLG